MRRIALLLTLGTAIAVPAATSQAAAPDGLIAYSSGRIVYSVPPDGSAPPHRIGRGSEPQWSPDGKQIAWYGPKGVWVARANGSRARLVVRGGHNPTWSPNGSRIAYLRGDDAIWTARPNGKAPRLLAKAGAFQSMFVGEPVGLDAVSWSPDGKRIAVLAEAAGAVTLEVGVSTIGVIGPIRRVPQSAGIADGVATGGAGENYAPGGPGGPAFTGGWIAWSPDSTTIASRAGTYGPTTVENPIDEQTLAGPYTVLLSASRAAPTFLAPPVPGIVASGYSWDGKRLCGLVAGGVGVLDLAASTTTVAAPLPGFPNQYAFTCSWSRPMT